MPGWMWTAAWACGPDFAEHLLDDRAATLLSAPDGTFAGEIARILPPSDGFAEPGWHLETADVERMLPGAEAVARVRQAADADAAWALGASLPPAIRAYTAGAVALHGGDEEEAARRFAQVLALPPPERASRAAWAAYALAGLSTDPLAWTTVRAEVAAGAEDPLGLAVASLGEEARRHLWQGDVPAAVALYLQQAADGSPGAVTSLLFVARRLLADPEALDAALADPATARLFAVYVWTRSGELDGRFGPVTAEQALDHLAPLAGPTGMADRLAALAYARQQPDRARALAAGVDTPLAAWVRAKVALRAGDLDEAAREYATAAEGFPEIEPLRGRVDRERGALDLARGQYVDALRTMFRATARGWRDGAYDNAGWDDAAFVAERVLTVDELRGFVDAEVPPGDLFSENPARELRSLLARRLVRAGRAAEAVAYFDRPDQRERAALYADALDREARATDPFDAARAGFSAARMEARGLWLRGTDQAPDFAAYQGEYHPDWFEVVPPPPWALGPGEDERLASTAPGDRLEGKRAAARHAEAVADRLPPRSQAFAAVLCQATSWVIDDDAELRDHLYVRYLGQGAIYPGSGAFGRDCPEPDWDGLAHWKPPPPRVRWPWLAAGAATLLAGLAWTLRRR